MANANNEIKRIESKEVAKVIRKVLKQFGHRFSVRSDFSSINVSWVDGPTVAEVEAAIGHYRAGHFDGMTDCFEYDAPAVEVNGEMVRCGNRYVFTSREASQETRDAIRAEIVEAAGIDEWTDCVVAAGVVEGKVVRFAHPNEGAGIVWCQAFSARSLPATKAKLETARGW